MIKKTLELSQESLLRQVMIEISKLDPAICVTKEVSEAIQKANIMYLWWSLIFYQ